VAALCVGFLPTNLIWATKGMEVGIVAAAATVTWAAWAERHELAAWASAAILVLLRIDGVALAVLLLLGTLARERRLPWRGLLCFIILLLPWLIFATLYFGSPVPASLQAKLIIYGRDTHVSFPRLSEFLHLMLHRAGMVLALGCLFALLAMLRSLRSVIGTAGARLTPPEWLLIPPGLWLLTYYGSMALSKVFLFGWYFVPPSPIYYLIAMVGWSLTIEWIARTLRRRQNAPVKWAAYVAAATGLAALVLTATFLPTVLQDLRTTQQVERDLRIPIGRWLHDHARPTDTVMMEPIGYIGFYSGLRVLDTVALVSPEVLPLYGPHFASPYHAIWTRFTPEYVLLRAGEWENLRRYESGLPPTQRLEDHYQLIHTWSDLDHPGSGVSFYLFRRK
jgi:hypothetical protein